MKFLKIEGLDFEVAEADAPYELNLKTAKRYAADNGGEVPSKDALHLMYLHKSKIPGLTGSWYWSSTENFNCGISRVERFSDGFQGYYCEGNLCVVRCVRRCTI